MAVELDRVAVEAGGAVKVGLTVTNTRASDALFEEPCAGEHMVVELRPPVEPAGRAWDGVAAEFKTYALEQSTGEPIESSVRGTLRTVARGDPCHATLAPNTTEDFLPTSMIPAGQRYETTLTWHAELVRDVPAVPGVAPFTVTVRYDHEAAGGGLIRAESLVVEGTIRIVEGEASAISAGQALDAAIGDETFAGWLQEQPASTWVNANLFLQPGANGVAQLPAVPYWDIELFSEPRSWGIVYVDALTGAVLDRLICETPCDR